MFYETAMNTHATKIYTSITTLSMHQQMAQSRQVTSYHPYCQSKLHIRKKSKVSPEQQNIRNSKHVLIGSFGWKSTDVTVPL